MYFFILVFSDPILFSLFFFCALIFLSSTFYLSPLSFFAYPLLSLSPSVSFFVYLLLSFFFSDFLCLSSNFYFSFYLFLCLPPSFLALSVFYYTSLTLLFIFLRICVFLLLSFLSSCSSFLYFPPFSFLYAFSAYFSIFFFLFYFSTLLFFPLSLIILC